MKHRVIMVMGVAGAGKTTVGKALAQAIDAQFLDADDYHSKANLAHMAAGRPLNDTMRWPWLDLVGSAVKEAAAIDQTVFACSALKRIYRDYLRASLRYTLVYPDAPIGLVQKRFPKLGKGSIPKRFLRNQYEVLSPPTKDEGPIIVSADQSVADIVAEILTQLD